MECIKNYLHARWTEISTKYGLVLTTISTVAIQFQSIDVKFAYIGAVAGFLLILYKES